jgi:hypothetical protein
MDETELRIHRPKKNELQIQFIFMVWDKVLDSRVYR